MFNFLKKLFGGGKKMEEIRDLIANGAIIVDVRTSAEFAGGHPKNAKNIPLQQIESQIDKIKSWNKPVILCCASGMRSGSATSILRQKGIEAHNAGSWYNLS